MERKEYVLSDLVFDDDFTNVFNLEKDQLVILINQYYSGAFTANKLAEIYQLDKKVKSNIPKFFPRVVSEQNCRHCDAVMIGTLASKSAGKLYNELKCPACGHLENTGGWRTVRCSCALCQKEQEHAFQLEKQRRQQEYEEELEKTRLENEKKRTFLRVNSYTQPVAIQSLTLQQKLYLSVLLRECLNESGYICLEDKHQNLAPSTNDSRSILETLVESGCIKISVDSPLNSLIVNQDGSISYYIYKIYYELNVYCCDGDDESILERAIYPDPHEFLVNDKFCLNMWEDIAYSEALEYLLFKMRSVGYDSFSPGEKTKIVLKKLLENFSVAQVYNIIYRAIANSTEAYQSGRAQYKKHASNMVIASCESYGERAILSNWELKPYIREKQLPQSQLSRTFFDAILQIGTDGFYKVPHIQCYEESL